MTVELESLRREVRAWLDQHTPRDWRTAMTNAEQDTFVALQKQWFNKLVEAGYATPHWPEGWPGGGRSLAAQKVIYEEVARAGWLIDLGTARAGANPARPDAEGRIRRELAPNVNIANFSEMLGRLSIKS